MAKYPINLELQGRRVVIIGAGPIALRKAEAVLDAGARVTVIADNVSSPSLAILSHDRTELIRAKYSKEYVVEASLVIAATNDRALNERIYKDCQELEIWCNVVDQPDLCDFYVPAVIQRGNLQLAISTSGACPAFAGHIRKKLEGIITEEYGSFLDALERVRQRVIQELPDMASKKSVLGDLVQDESFDYFVKNGPAAWNDRADKIISDYLAKT